MAVKSAGGKRCGGCPKSPRHAASACVSRPPAWVPGAVLDERGSTCSMRRRGNCLDNATMESWKRGGERIEVPAQTTAGKLSLR